MLYLLFFLFIPPFLFILTLRVCYYDDHILFQLIRGFTLAVGDLLVHDNGLRGCAVICFLLSWVLFYLQNKTTLKTNILLVYRT